MRITFMLLTTLLLCAISPAKAQMSFSDSALTYLKENAKDFQKNRGYLVDDDIAANNQIFFIQENHAIKENCAVELALIEELKAKTNFTYYLAELDLAEAAELNEYLKTGNEAILKNHFEDNKGVFEWMQEHYAFYQNIYRLNQKYDKKIQLLGVDIAISKDFGLGYLKDLLKESPNTKTIIDSIDSASNSGTADFNFVRRIKTSIELLLQADKTLDTFTIRYHLNNILNYEKASNSQNWDATRDSLIFENYQMLVNHFGIQKEVMVGVWGRDHGLQKDHSNTKWFASSLKQNLKLSIYTYNIFYLDCQQRFPRVFLPSFLKPFYGWGKTYNRIGICNDNNTAMGKKPAIELLKRASTPHSISFFRLDRPSSPFSQPQLGVIMLVCKIPLGGKLVTTDFFQTAILIRNSEAATPLMQ